MKDTAKYLEARHWVQLWLGISSLVVLLILGIAAIHHRETMHYIEHGYIRKAVQSGAIIQWGKE